MFAIKKFAPLLALLALSCGKHASDDFTYSSVTFVNNSSFSISIHSTSFSGPVLVDKLPSGMRFSTTISPSDNYGAGSVFSIEYWYRVVSSTESSCGDVWTGGIDPNMQITQNIEAGGNYTIPIPQPKSLELKEAFIKILNSSDKPFELNYGSITFRQAGNGELSVPNGKVGIYQVNGEINGYTITQVFKQYQFPNFTAENGFIYNFVFDGISVRSTGEQKIASWLKL